MLKIVHLIMETGRGVEAGSKRGEPGMRGGERESAGEYAGAKRAKMESARQQHVKE